MRSFVATVLCVVLAAAETRDQSTGEVAAVREIEVLQHSMF